MASIKHVKKGEKKANKKDILKKPNNNKQFEKKARSFLVQQMEVVQS